ncbi:TlpA disulfide reductase family protein [Arsenicibacter rosenii]|uniref:Alkyl hydroperoxide reductase n=1 Tax=Arsenicibacter rosenii TaxID=1750698 RepID=A0A1S2VHJ5_9BACT|nr:TlpA disulfide reductase family protein [Arsenicibacter rosenii]OIN57880.1 alkyl hydroperoxide reductase [Arsenicibacter rosenii]
MKKILTICLLAFAGMPVLVSAQSTASVKSGAWRAVIKNAGGELPFGLDVQPTADPAKGVHTYTVYAVNGAERLPMDAASMQGDTLRIPMALFDSEIVAHVSGNTMKGYWKRRRVAQQYQTLPFEAQYGTAARFKPTTTDQAKASFGGTWAVTFSEPDGSGAYPAVGIFKQTGNQVTGTFLTETGDYRYLAGNVYGDSLLLSCFDGSHLFTFKAKQNADRTLKGDFWAGVAGHEIWTAKPDPKAALPDPAKLTYIKEGQSFAFSFPQPDGKQLSLNDERFNGKVTVVQILGTWCPNCMDETRFLAPWYKRNQKRGVEIVGLAFEKTADLAESGPKIQRMKERFGVEYPVLLAGTSDKAQASKALPALNRVVAFPTTIFIDKKGKVRHIHTGFSGPGTGKYYDQYIGEYNRLIDKLLAE